MHQYPTYTIEGGKRVSTGRGMRIEWQEGPFAEAGPNGSMPEQPVRAVIQRLAHLNESLPCEQNRQMIEHLNAVLGLMDERTRERNNRGVLGTGQP